MNVQSTNTDHGLPDFPTSGLSNFIFPAEWHPHTATWLSWPHKEASWPGKLESVYEPYAEFIRYLAEGEQVRINVYDLYMRDHAEKILVKKGVDMRRVEFFLHPTNDAWCRDHGPAFLIDPVGKRKAVVNWGYNAWGDKYPPYDLDNAIPIRIAEELDLEVFHPDIIMEGGSVDFNGAGTVLTTRACLLNPNRNPELNQAQIEQYLKRFYGVKQVLWLGDGIIGDDTDGHIDDITRFVNEDTVVTAVEENTADENHAILQENLEALKKMRLPDGRPLNVIELPMPDPVLHEGTRLPASYANFYISNRHVIVPTYRCAHDQRALDILQAVFTTRNVVGIDSTDIIWGLGSFHCLSQQEPEV